MEFQKFGGEKIVNIQQYVADLTKQDSTVGISVGCDSKQLRYKTQYAVVVVAHSPIFKAGAHVVYSRFKVEKIRDRFIRLWKECEYIAEIAEELHTILHEIGYKRSNQNGFYKLVDVHLDLNPDENYGSHKVYTPAISWFKGMGYKTLAKPEAHSSTVAADKLCK